MKREHRDDLLYGILHYTPEASFKVQKQINDAYEQIREGRTGTADIRMKRRHRKLRSRSLIGLAAAILLLVTFLGFGNPALAAKIPFIGRIFRLVETEIGYQGNYSEHAVPVTPSPATSSGSEAPEDFSQTAKNVTVTFSEASYSEMALYFSLEIYSEEGFPEDFNRVKNMEGYILSYDILNMISRQSFDFSEAEDLYGPFSIEGNYADSHTFLGVIRVDLNEVRRLLEMDTLPPEFVYSLTIDRFWGSLSETESVTASNSETGETLVIQQPVKKYYEGPWSFTIPVSMDGTEAQRKELNDTNETGFGIATVVKTPYEIKAEPILPDSADPFDYIVVITDADGKILDSQGSIVEVYSVYGRNTDTVHIYVLDEITYFDECKSDNAYLLPEKALYQTTVTW